MQITSMVENLLFSTVRIETTTSTELGAGTAFIFSYTRDEKQFLFLVTNKHVVEDSIKGNFFFTLGDKHIPQIGQRCNIEIDKFEQQWFGHPDPATDVAIMPLVPIIKKIEEGGQTIFFRAIPDTMVPNPEQFEELDAIEEVVFIGYPNGMFDRKNLMPIIRRGTTATHLHIDYEGKPQFLIDASVFPGSSGSPVLIVNNGNYTSKNGTLNLGSNRILFLGLISSVAVREEEGLITFKTAPVSQMPIVKIHQTLNLGVVIKSPTIIETINAFLNNFCS